MSNPGNKFKEKLTKKCTVFMLLAFLGALIYSCGVIHWASTENQTHFSENALLPGLVDEIFDSGDEIYSNLNKLTEILKKLQHNNGKNWLIDSSTLKFLFDQFSSSGLETYVQNFTLDGSNFIRKESIPGHNVYGFARSSRGSSNEAIVVATSFQSGNLPALALMLTLAKFCREQIFWAKDIIFVSVEHGELGMLAWLESYHEKFTNPNIASDHFWAHGGSIQAAIVLDTVRLKKKPITVSRADLSINMLNGQLANLDFVNLAVRMLEKHGLLATIYNREDFWGTDYQEKLLHAAATASRALLDQSSSRPQGLHSFFGSFGIEALTLKLDYNKYDRKFPLIQVAHVLEGMLRSVNNLLEKFHQSYFFYVLFSSHHYAPSAAYMPTIGIMVAALLIKVCSIWLTLFGATNDAENDATVPDVQEPIDYFYVVFVLLFSHSIGLIIKFIPTLLLDQTNVENLMPLVIGLILVVCTGLRLFYMKPKLKNVPVSSTVLLLHGIAVLELALILGVTSVLNFGLGYYLCIVMVPALIIINPSTTNLKRGINYVTTLFINPLFLICLYDSIYNGRLTSFNYILNGTESIADLYALMNGDFLQLVFDHYLFSSWQFVLVATGLIPFWICCWISIVIY